MQVTHVASEAEAEQLKRQMKEVLAKKEKESGKEMKGLAEKEQARLPPKRERWPR